MYTAIIKSILTYGALRKGKTTELIPNRKKSFTRTGKHRCWTVVSSLIEHHEVSITSSKGASLNESEDIAIQYSIKIASTKLTL